MNNETKATIFVLSDFPPRPVDVILFFARAKGDDSKTIFNLAAEMYLSGIAKNIMINGSDGNRENGSGPRVWAGKTKWIKRLNNLGIKKVDCFPPAWNTTDEAYKMVAYAKKKGWRSAVILALPHQVLRCMAAMVKSMKKNTWPMKVYCATPKSCNWFEKTLGSQGEKFMERQEHIDEEYNRIKKYSSVKHIANLKEVLSYFKNRKV